MIVVETLNSCFHLLVVYWVWTTYKLSIVALSDMVCVCECVCVNNVFLSGC